MAGGSKAKAQGDTYEDLVDLSLRRYAAADLITWSPTYLASRITGQDWKGNPIIKIVGKAQPDRRVTLAPEGHIIWLEIKKFSNKNNLTYDLENHPDRKSQYLTLKAESQMGASAFYLVCWVWAGREEWRLHDVRSISVNDRSEIDNIFFERAQGIPVDSSPGFPRWLHAIAPNLSKILV